VQGGASAQFSAAELLEVLRPDFKAGDEVQGSVVSDAQLERLLDRTHMVADKPVPYALVGPGYECIQNSNEATMLQGING
jgi:hypothetical protein